MKAGRTLQELATEIQRQQGAKRDFVAPARALTMELMDEAPVFEIKGTTYPIKKMAHQQLAEHLQIPKAYYDRMLVDDPLLLKQNVNNWLQKSDDTRMLRTFGEPTVADLYGVRAYLSNSFRPLDNLDLAEAILPTIFEHRWQIKSCEVTETRLYVKIVSEDITAEIAQDHVNVRTGGRTHIVHPGLTITNSEVGMGSLKVEPTVHWQHCLNLATLNASVRRAHLGRKTGGNGEHDDLIQAYVSDNTRQLQDAAVWSAVNDVVKATLNEQVFIKMIAQVSASCQDRIIDVEQIIDITAQQYELSEPTRKSVLQHLIEGSDLSRYGLSMALTRASQDVDDYDEATRLERVGGQLIELPQGAWKELVAMPVKTRKNGEKVLA